MYTPSEETVNVLRQAGYNSALLASAIEEFAELQTRFSTLVDATDKDFLAANQVIQDEYASQQPGYLSRETGISEGGQWWIAIQWETKADSDASIAGFGEAPGLEDFMTTLNPETMIITQYELKSGADQSTFPGTGAVEVITMRLQDGADVDGFLAANKVIRDKYASQQPGFIARQAVVSDEYAISSSVVHFDALAEIVVEVIPVDVLNVGLLNNF